MQSMPFMPARPIMQSMLLMPLAPVPSVTDLPTRRYVRAYVIYISIRVALRAVITVRVASHPAYAVAMATTTVMYVEQPLVP